MNPLIQSIPAFALATLFLVMVPGQGVAMVLRQSILGGNKAAIFSSLGNCVGILLWSIASALGLSAVFTQSQVAYTLLKWSGVFFLLVIALQTALALRQEFGAFDLEGSKEFTKWSSFRIGLFTNLTNVKAAVYAVAFIPAFIPQGFPIGWGVMIFGGIWALISLLWNLSLIWSVGQSSNFIQQPRIRRALTAVSALGIFTLAIGLALS